MRNLQPAEVNAVSGGLGYWADDVVYDCYLDTWTGVEYCDVYTVSTYYSYSTLEEALIWTAVGIAAAGIIAGTTAAIVLA